MKNQIVKGISMLTLLVAVAFATAVVSANAQSSKLVISNVPFNFVVGDQTMPAGEYRIRRASALSNGLIIQSSDATSSAMRLSNAIEPSSEKTNARLVFHRYGSHYFLTEVWSGGDNEGRELTKSRQERASRRELATLSSKGNGTYAIVEIAATLR